MAVRVALRSPGAPARMRAAMFGIVATPVQVTGGWDHRVVATYGTHPVPAPGPGIVMAVPPGPTAGHTAATGYQLYPTIGVVHPNLPRVLPGAGYDRWLEPPYSGTGVPAGAQPVQGPLRHRVIQTGGNQGRVTYQPKPTRKWPVQGQ